MFIKLNGLEIENKHLSTVDWWSGYLIFIGVALEEEGKRICDLLSKFKEDQIVEVEAKDKNYRPYEGTCRIVKICMHAFGKPVEVELIKSVISGSDSCKFFIHI